MKMAIDNPHQIQMRKLEIKLQLYLTRVLQKVLDMQLVAG